MCIAKSYPQKLINLSIEDFKTYVLSEYEKKIGYAAMAYDVSIEEGITVEIINKVKKLIEYVNYIYYDVLECNDDLFTSYIGIIYYILLFGSLKWRNYISNTELWARPRLHRR